METMTTIELVLAWTAAGFLICAAGAFATFIVASTYAHLRRMYRNGDFR